jgi:hypothetical protein
MADLAKGDVAVEATQPASADHSDRGGEDGAPKQPSLGDNL